MNFFTEDSDLVTLHIVLSSPEIDSFVWVTDRLALLGLDGYATVEKITHLKEQNIACSIWGDGLAMLARDRLMERITASPIANRSPSEITVFLREFGTEIFPEGQHLKVNLTAQRGILLALLGKNPRVYRLDLCWPPIAASIIGQTTAGDESNPALLFTNYYYELCGKTISELLCIGIHAMRIAEKMNSKGIRGVDAWVCEKGDFRQLTNKELTPYIASSESLDAMTLDSFRESDHRA
jgi:hypothetical protein